jgi:hypothetical protein
MSEDFWTPGRIEKVRTLWARGDSASAIGRAIGANKNQVIGKVRRLGLANRPSPITGIVGNRKPDKSRRSTVPKAPTMAELVRLPIRTPAQVSKTEEFATRPKHKRQFLDVVTLEVKSQNEPGLYIPRKNPLVWLGKLSGGTKTCQYPMTDARPWLMCDAPTVTGLSWCAEHRAVCFVRKEELVHGRIQT